MMTASHKKFAQLLTEGIHRVRLRENKTVQIVQDELGYALGREGGSAIEYWRKGHIPSRPEEVADLARQLVRRGRLDAEWLGQFLRSAAYPQPEALHRELFPPEKLPVMARLSSDNVSTGDFSFVAGPPITQPAQFWGRDREIKRLFNLWQRPPLQNGAIIGPRRSGKTSLLHYLRQITTTPIEQRRPDQRHGWLPQPEQYRWIFVDFQDHRLGSQAGLMHYLLDELDLPRPTPCDLNAFLDVVGDGLRQPTIILLDEIGVALERYPELDDAFWESLRSLATNQVGGNLGFVLTAATPPDQLARRSQLGSPFFNIFGYAAMLGPFTEAEARAFIAATSIPFSETDVEWLLTQSRGWPLLLQILCRERRLALEEDSTDTTWREEALAQLAPFRHLLQES
jgi:hypothetical protein